MSQKIKPLFNCTCGTKTLYNWVDDEQVTKCYDCKTKFLERNIWNGYSSESIIVEIAEEFSVVNALNMKQYWKK